MVEVTFPEGDDTRLARELHARGWVEVGQLQSCLEEVRTQRSSGRVVPLAGLLIERRLVDAETLRGLAVGGLAGAWSSGSPAGQSAGQVPAGLAPAGLAPAGLVPAGLVPAGLVPAGLASAGLASATAEIPPLPTQLGNYRLGRQLGCGGMGAVYEATHVVTGQIYAIKLMDPVLVATGDSEARERFRREAQLASRLDHPHVVSVVDADCTGRFPWIVQDLLSGETLSALLRRRGALPWREGVALLLPIADALGHAHDLGVLHRDLKPANILFDGEGRPCLADFGLAREASGEALRLTLSGEAIGTPNYMAPEQASGARDQGPSLDVYGLCAVLFQVVGGEPPFAEATVIKTLQKIVNDPAPRLAALASVPPALDELVARGLAKDPQDRPRTGAELAAALRDCLELSPDLGSGEGSAERGRGVALGVAALLGAIVLCGLIALALTLAPAEPPPGSPTPALTEASPVEASSPREPLLSAAELGAPADWRMAWQLGPQAAEPREPVLWASGVADPLGALTRPGGAQAAFLGDAEPLGEGRWRVRYAPHRGLIPRVGRHPGYLVRSLPSRGDLLEPPAYRWLAPGAGHEGRALVGCPNDGGELRLYAGRACWARPRVTARLGVERIDRGSILVYDGSGVMIRYMSRSQQFNRGAATARATWTEVSSLVIDADAAEGRIKLGSQTFDELLPRSEPRTEARTPNLLVVEGWFVVDSLSVEGTPLRPDRAALASPQPPPPPATHGVLGLRFRAGPGLGGPCLDLGRGPGRVRFSVGQGALRLELGERLLGSLRLPRGVLEGTLSLSRAGDVLTGRLESGSEEWSLSRVVPFRIPPGWSYGSTGPRLEVLAASLALGPVDEERLAHDEGQRIDSDLGLWRSSALGLEALFDPFRLDAGLRTRVEDRNRAFMEFARRLSDLAPRLRVGPRRDALARALVAAVYAGQGNAAAELGKRLASAGVREGLEAVDWLGGGELAELMKSGLRVSTESPAIARAGARGILPLLPEAERPQAEWTLARGERLVFEAIRKRRALEAREKESVGTLTARLEAIRLTGYRGPTGREVLLDLAWCYAALDNEPLYRERIEDALLTKAGSTYSWAWAGYGRHLVERGKFGEGVEKLLAALARAPGNGSIRGTCARTIQRVGARCPEAPLAALAWGLAEVRDSRADWAQLARALAGRALEDPNTSPRHKVVAGLVLLRLTGERPPGLPEVEGLSAFLGWVEEGVLPKAGALRAAVAADRLVEHLALFDPGYSGLLGR